MLTPLQPPLDSIAPIVFFSAIVFLAAVGGMLMASAWRGRALAWAPTCAWCGFDLRASAAALPDHCPECGRSLAGAVELGPRTMRFGRMALGVVVLAGGAFLAVSLPTGLASSINAWILSMRSIDAFTNELDQGDPRAWRVVLDRVAQKRVSAPEVDALLDRVLARVSRNSSVSGNHRMALTALADSGLAPADLPKRVFDTLAGLPNPVRLTVAPNDVASGGALAISGTVFDWPALQDLALEVNVVSVIDDAGRPLPWLSSSAIESARLSRRLQNTRLIRAPTDAGPHRLRAIVEVIAIRGPAIPAANPGHTPAGPIQIGPVPATQSNVGNAGIGESKTVEAGDVPTIEAAPLWKRTIEIPFQISVTGKPRG